MKCISIQQPFAWLVAIGAKNVENRSRQTKYRGEILIHAGLKKEWLEEFLEDFPDCEVDENWFTLGAVVGSAVLVDCQKMSPELEENIWAGGEFCYNLRDTKWFTEPISCKGKLGIYDIEPSLMPKIAKQMAAPARSCGESETKFVEAIKSRLAVSHLEDLIEDKSADEDYVGVIKIADRGIALLPDDAAFYEYKGDAFAGMDDFASAKRCYEDAIRRDSDNASVLRSLGRILADLKDFEAARTHLAKALDFEPNDPHIHSTLGDVLEMSGDLAGALSSYKKANQILFLHYFGIEDDCDDEEDVESDEED